MQRIVFGLKDVYNAQCANAGIGLTSSALKLNIPGLSHGYVCGGVFTPPTTYYNTIDKQDFQTEVVSTPGNNLSQARGYQLGGVSSENYGYACGGWTGSSNTSTIDRVDFTTDTVAQPGNPLGRSNYSLGSVSGPVYGYIAGGTNPTVCTITRLDFSTETCSANPGQLTHNRSGSAGMRSPSYGYFAGGLDTTPVSVCTIDRLDFSNDTVSDASNLPVNLWFFYGVSTPDYGYTAGGNDNISSISDVIRLDFSTDNTTTISANLNANKYSAVSIQSLDFGYWSGGWQPGYVCTINRLDFSSETMSQPSPQMPAPRGGRAGLQINRPQVFKYVPGNSLWKESPDHGYYGSGEDASSNTLSTISKIDFSSETLSNPSATITTSPIFTAGTQNSNYGYYVNGYDGTSNHCTVNRFDFSNETLVNSAAKTNRATRGAGGVESKDYAYFGGGYGPADLSTIDRMDFSTEVTSLPGTFLSQGRGGLCGSNNGDYGYFAGGPNPFIPALHNCRIDRIDFSTETVTNPPVSLSDDKRFVGGFESQSYGYFAGGSAPSAAVDAGCRSNIDKMDFSSETLERLSAQLSVKRDLPGATSNFAYGYIGGGRVFPPSNIRVSTIDRLDFISDTISTPSSKLPSARSAATGVSGGIATRRVGGATYGYFGSGIDSGVLCTIDRLEFSTETISAPGTYQVTQARRNLAATSSSFYGYFGGGYIPPNVHQCTIDRLDFSNETVSANPGQLTQARSFLSATSSSSYGYFGGGNAPPAVCTIDRLDFSSETVSNPPASLTQRRNQLAATSSNSYSYFAGGYDPNTFVCTIDRLDLSTETTSNPPASLTQARIALTATSSSSYGYFGGGYAPSLPGNVCAIDRIDFSNETVSANPGQLTQARSQSAATSSSFYGYFGGGDGAGTGSTIIDRLDFAAETVSLPSQNLTQARRGLAAFSNG